MVNVVHFVISSVNIVGCYFDNNTVPLTKGGSLRFDNGEVFPAKIWISNTIIKGGIESESENFDNSLVAISASHMKFSEYFNISCPTNYNLIYVYKNKHGCGKLQVFCKKCSNSTYSLDFANITWNETKNSFNYQSITCTTCPHEAISQRRIKSKGNYWGYKTENNTVKFVYCPSSYCCISPSYCSSYDTCYRNRHSILCSECLRNYSVGLFGQNRCIESVSCSRFYFWIIYVVSIVFYLLFFMYIQDIFLFIKRTVQKFGCCCHVVVSDATVNQQDEGVSFVSVDLDENSFQLIPNDSGGVSEYPEQSYQISGIIKILFFFYQTALIIRINSPAKSQLSVPKFADILLSFFNVKIDTNSQYFELCPFENSDVLHVEIIRYGVLIICPFSLFLTAITCATYKQTLLRILPFQQSIENETDYRCIFKIDNGVPHYAKLPLLVRIKMAYIQLLLIGFASIAVLLLKMIHCIEINDEKYLYVKASVKCYTKLQKIVLVIIGSWVVPFWFSLYVSCYLLRNCKITPNQFIFISTFPPSILIYVLKSRLQQENSSLSLKNAMLAKEILRVVNQPFKNSPGKSFKIQWESVLILRRLFLIIVSTFFISPFEKLYPIGFLLVLYLIHHMFMQPYKDVSLNIAEGVSLAVLCFLTLINNFWAFSNEIEIMHNPLFKKSANIFL